MLNVCQEPSAHIATSHKYYKYPRIKRKVYCAIMSPAPPTTPKERLSKTVQGSS